MCYQHCSLMICLPDCKTDCSCHGMPLNSMSSSAELCRNVHPDQRFVRSADEAYTRISALTVGFNSDRTLYEPLEELHNATTGSSSRKVILSDEDKTMLESLKLDFERGGIHLPSAERNRIADLQNRANALGAKFSSNASSSSAEFDVEVAKLNALPAHLRARLPRVKGDPKRVRLCAGDPTISGFVMKHIRDPSIRRNMYVAEHSRSAKANLKVLDELLSARHDLAKLLGFEGYAHLMFEGRLASSPEDVQLFLHDLSQFVRPMAEGESNTLLERKIREERDEQSQLFAWDRSYYMGVVKSSTSEIDSGDIAKYFPLDACLQGIALVTEMIFGISLVPVPRSGCADELWHGEVQKIELRHESEGVLGHVFLDLYPRDGKYNHAAHFSIRCGRDPGDGRAYQTPVVALVCNFTRSDPHARTLLTFSDYETLWHEFGHALHSLLSRTKYQHLSGTRVPTDFVEVPSHLFEYFAWDPRVLSRVTRHFASGDPMPTQHIHALCSSRHQFVASDIQWQLLYASLDLEFHSASPPIGETTESVAKIQRKLTAIPHVPGTALQASFQHFVTYGAGYYSCTFKPSSVFFGYRTWF
jgi:mitochondrial intermediate peptidase